MTYFAFYIKARTELGAIVAGILLGVYTILQKFSCWFFGAKKKELVSPHAKNTLQIYSLYFLQFLVVSEFPL